MPSQDGTASTIAALNDEREALNSIYGSNTLVFQEGSSSPVIGILDLPESPFAFLLSFPEQYPDVPPDILGTNSTGHTVRGEGESAVHTLRRTLEEIFIPGQVCLFDLVEEAGPLLRQAHGATHDHLAADAVTVTEVASFMPVDGEQEPPDHPPTPPGPQPSPAWILSEPVTVNKSTFVARVCAVASTVESSDAVGHLLSTNKKVAGATHNITAWRIRSTHTHTGNVTTVQDCDDDGETAAGGRLLHLLQLMDVWNVLIVVTRWYGGVKLGPERFKLINQVARDALIKANFATAEGDKPKGRGKVKKSDRGS